MSNRLKPSKLSALSRRSFLKSSVNSALTAALASNAITAQSLLAATDTLTNIEADVEAVTGDGKSITLERAAIKELAESLRGQCLLSGHDGYDLARKLLDPSFDKHPALIIRPTGPTDVANAVQFANERNLLLAVKCGGHSASGKSTCEKGMQIDLSSMRHVRVNPLTQTATASGGSLLGELDHEAMAHGLVTTAGTVSHTGIGGLTLGGGFGRVGRRFGLTLDNVEGVGIVNADGQWRKATPEQNPELYWAVRGGGGNFGVVTSFDFKLHPMQRKVIGGELIFPLDKMREMLTMYADYAHTAPDELYLDIGAMSRLGDSGGTCFVGLCYSGDPDKAEKVLAPIRKIGTPLRDNISSMDYVALQKRYDNNEPRMNASYMKSGFVSEIPKGLIENIVDNFDTDPARTTQFYMQHSGGAINRVASDATAFAHRTAIANLMAFISYPNADQRKPHVKALKSYWATLEPFTEGFYSNSLLDQEQEQVNSNFKGNYPRLMKIKQQYDPNNLFRLNANIKPMA